MSTRNNDNGNSNTLPVSIHQLLDSFSEAVMIHPLTEDLLPGKFVAVNDEACRMLGYTKDELLELSPIDIDATEIRVDIKEVIRELLKGEDVVFEQIHVAKSGWRFPVVIKAKLLIIDGVPHSVSTVSYKAHEETLSHDYRSSFRYLRAAIQSSVNAMVLLNRDFEIEAFNDVADSAFRTIKGITLRSGAPLLSMVAEELHEIEILRFKTVLQGTKIQMDRKFSSLNNEVYWFRVSYTPLYDRGSKIIGIMLTGENITEKKRAEEAEAESNFMLKTVTDNIPVVLVLYDANLRIQFSNISKFQFGSPLNEVSLIGKTNEEIFPPQVYEDYLPQLQAVLRSKKVTSNRTTLQTSDGITIEFKVTYVPILTYDGKIKNILAVGTDITEIRKHESELEQTNQQKDKLISVLAHDLLNPFQTLLGLTRVLNDESFDIDAARRKKYTQELEYVSVSTYQTLKNLLEWVRSRGDCPHAEKECLPVKDLIREYFDYFSILADKKGIRLLKNIPDDLTIIACRQMAQSIVRNLLTNAIKFTSVGGVVEINGYDEEDYSVLEIRDNGTGMDEETKNQILYGSVTESTLGTKKEKGTGIGLQLTRDFIIKNNARWEIDTTPGEGTTFRIKFPIG